MGELIEALLQFSRLGRAEMQRSYVDLSQLGRAVAAELAQSSPERQADFVIQEGLIAHGDGRLLRIVVANLLGNAWKFTIHARPSKIEMCSMPGDTDLIFFVRDNGVGFNRAYASRLFTPFQRLHPDSDFPGSGIGLATVSRIVERHGGKVWAEGEVGHGATIFFTLPPSPLPISSKRGVLPK
jgi:light-regulated signal transduction histidine kinase (bacteriophytochrome)